MIGFVWELMAHVVIINIRQMALKTFCLIRALLSTGSGTIVFSTLEQVQVQVLP